MHRNRDDDDDEGAASHNESLHTETRTVCWEQNLI